MTYSSTVRFVGILMGIGIVVLSVFVGALMLLSGLNGTRSYSIYYLFALILLLLLGICIILYSWRKRKKETPVFFGIITVFSLVGLLFVRGAVGIVPELLLLIEGLLSAFLTYQTQKENRNM